MKKLLVLLTILSSIIAYAEDTIELEQTTVKGSKTSDYTAPPKEQKNTFVITQERIREKNYKNVEDILMKKLLVLLTILSSIMAYAEDTIELDQTTVKSSPRSSDYTLIPKEQKNTYVITQEKIRERNYKNVEDVLRDAPGVTIQNTAFGPRVDMRGSGEKSLSRVKV